LGEILAVRENSNRSKNREVFIRTFWVANTQAKMSKWERLKMMWEI